MKRSVLLFVLATIALTGINGQQMMLTPSVLASAGAYGESENYTISWTLGELAVTTLNGENYILTQGFQQSFGLDVGAREKASDLNISVYPNPVEHDLFIRFGIEKVGDYLLEIEDVTGRIVYQQKHQQMNPGDIIRINTSAYSSGIYFLRILKTDLSQMKVTGIRKL